MLRFVALMSVMMVITFSARAQGVLNQVHGRWAIGTTANCSSAYYDWSLRSVSGAEITFRDVRGRQNRENVDGVRGNRFTTTTIESSDTPLGTEWSYLALDQDSFQVRRASNGREFRLVRCPALNAGALSSGAVGIAGASRASRNAEPGCRWVPFTAASFGLRLLVQECSPQGLRYVFSVRDDWIEMHRPANDRTFGSPQLIRLLMKSDDVAIEEAISRFAASTLPKEAHGACAVRPAPQVPPGPAGRSYFTLMPTGAYARKIDAELKEGPRDFGCGPYGAGQASTYFEYHPAESTSKFLFVNAGQDAPLFDAASLQFDVP